MSRLYCKSIYQGFHKWMGSIAFHDKIVNKGLREEWMPPAKVKVEVQLTISLNVQMNDNLPC